MSPAEFRDYYENQHIPLCMKYNQGLVHYERRYVDPPIDAETGEPVEMDFDVITELGFARRDTRDATLAFMRNGQLPQEVIDDEMRVFDRSSIHAVAIDSCQTELAIKDQNQ